MDPPKGSGQTSTHDGPTSDLLQDVPHTGIPQGTLHM